MMWQSPEYTHNPATQNAFILGTFSVQEQLYNKVSTYTSWHIFTIQWPAAHMFQIFPF